MIRLAGRLIFLTALVAIAEGLILIGPGSRSVAADSYLAACLPSTNA